MTRSRTKNIVLYADDDADDRDLLSEWLLPCRALIELRTFECGSSLNRYLQELDAAGEEAPSLVLLDQNMPGLTGLKTLEMIRADGRWENLPVVIYSTSSMPHEVIAAQCLSAGFITKPLNYDQRDRVLREMLAHCEPTFRDRVRELWSKGR